MAEEAKAHIISSQLRKLRKEAKYTQKELADKIGISRETVSAIEKGKEETISSIKFSVIGDWWIECKPRATEETCNQFFLTIVKYFGL